MNCLRINSFSWSRRVKISCSIFFLSKSSWISWVKIICVIKFNSTRFEFRSIYWVCYKDISIVDLFNELVDFLLVSLLQWHDQNQSLWWASWFSSSESATKTLSMQWFIYSHHSIYQWINLSHVSTSNSEFATMIVLFLS